MRKTFLAFGDSNTFGTPPMHERGPMQRFDAAHRWPCIAAGLADMDLIEEGLPGRTANPQPDPEMGAHMSGPLGLRIALESHGPIDVLAIMLGTNDMKAHFGLTPAAVAGAVGGLLAIAKSADMQARHGGFDVLVICPPRVKEQGAIRDVFFGAAAKSAELSTHYAALAAHWEVAFLDAGAHIGPSEIDGVHFDPAAQVALGKAVGAVLKAGIGAI